MQELLKNYNLKELNLNKNDKLYEMPRMFEKRGVRV